MHFLYSFLFSIIILFSETSGDQEALLFTEVGTVGDKTLYAELLSLVSWKEAYIFCRQKGMILASITSEPEKFLLRNYFTIVDLSPNTDFWLSGSDYGSAGDYYWMDSGALITDEPEVQGKGTCSDASTGGGYCSYSCSSANKCSCTTGCSGKCVTFKFESIENSTVGVGGCTSGRRFICQKLIN